MRELEEAINEIERTIAILRQSSCDRWTAELVTLQRKVKTDSSFTRKEALFSIGELCHPKALGDARVTAVEFESWNKQLEALHDACAKAFNILDRQAT